MIYWTETRKGLYNSIYLYTVLNKIKINFGIYIYLILYKYANERTRHKSADGITLNSEETFNRFIKIEIYQRTNKYKEAI